MFAPPHTKINGIPIHFKAFLKFSNYLASFTVTKNILTFAAYSCKTTIFLIFKKYHKVTKNVSFFFSKASFIMEGISQEVLIQKSQRFGKQLANSKAVESFLTQL